MKLKAPAVRLKEHYLKKSRGLPIMKRISCVPIILLFLTSVAMPEEKNNIRKLRELYKEGDQFFHDQKYDDAKNNFQEFLKFLPKGAVMNEPRSRAHYYLACCFSKLNSVNEGVEHLSKAMEFGFRDFRQIEGDNDLSELRQSTGYVSAVNKYKKLEEDKLQNIDFDLVTVNGEKVSKKDFLGNVLIVAVWGTWCRPCIQEVPHLIALQNKYKKDGLQVVGLNYEKVSNKTAAIRNIKAIIDRKGINYPCALATKEVLDTIPNLRGFPTTIFIGRDGLVRKMVTGGLDEHALERVIKPLLAEKPPPKSEKKDEKNSS